MRIRIVCLIGYICLTGWFVSNLCPAQESDSKYHAVESDLDLNLLKSVQHKTLNVLPGEREAYFHVLEQAARANPRALKAAARQFQKTRRHEDPKLKNIPEKEFPTFADLFQNFERYHGKPVTLKGHVRRLIQHPSRAGEPARYEAWVFTQDSQTNPAVIVCGSIPEGIPMGDNLLEKVSVTGYFFKLYVYEARDTTRLAPLIMAGNLEWFPSDKQAAPPIPPLYYAIAALGVVAALALILWFLNRTARKDRQFSGAVLDQLREADADELRESDLNIPHDL